MADEQPFELLSVATHDESELLLLAHVLEQGSRHAALLDLLLWESCVHLATGPRSPTTSTVSEGLGLQSCSKGW